MNKKLLLVALLLISSVGHAQVDSSKEVKVLDTLLIYDDFLAHIDSSEIREFSVDYSYFKNINLLEKEIQENIHIYDFKERNFSFSQDLGIKGSPSISVNQKWTQFMPLSSGMIDMALYWKNKNPFFSRKPFVDVLFVRSSTSADDELSYNIDHGQRIGHQLYYGLRFSKIGATGFYKEQTSNAGNFSFFTSYQNKKDNLFLFGEVEFYRNILDHNGGIKFEPAATGLPRNQQETYLTGVSSMQKLRKYKIIAKNKLRSGLSLFQSAELKQSYYVYKEFTSRQNFYDTTFSKGIGTYDSLRNNNILYKLGLANYTKGNFNFKLGGEVNYASFLSSSFTRTEIKDSTSGGTYIPSVININSEFSSEESIMSNYHGLFADINYSKGKKQFYFKANYCLACTDGDVYRFESGYEHMLDKATAGVNIGASSLSIPLIYRGLNSNHYKWKSESLNNPEELFFGIYLKHKIVDLKISYTQFKERLFMDSLSNPVQVGQKLTSLILDAFLNYNIYDWLFLQSRNCLQFSSDDYYLRAPKYWNFSNAYFQFHTKRGVIFRLGTEFIFSSDYLPYNYSPAASQFTLSSNGNFISTHVLNPFFSIEVEAVRIFAKMENASQNLFNERFYSTPNYPESDRVLRIGAAWTFYN